MLHDDDDVKALRGNRPAQVGAYVVRRRGAILATKDLAKGDEILAISTSLEMAMARMRTIKRKGSDGQRA
jgi:hypothetical protein